MKSYTGLSLLCGLALPGSPAQATPIALLSPTEGPSYLPLAFRWWSKTVRFFGRSRRSGVNLHAWNTAADNPPYGVGARDGQGL